MKPQPNMHQDSEDFMVQGKVLRSSESQKLNNKVKFEVKEQDLQGKDLEQQNLYLTQLSQTIDSELVSLS